MEGNAQDFLTTVETKLKNFSKKVKIKGFRAGKVPLSMLRQQHEKKFCVETIHELVAEALKKYLDENTLNIVGAPQYNEKASYIDFENHCFYYQFDVPLYTDYNLLIDTSVKVEDYVVNTIEQEVLTREISHLREKYGKKEEELSVTPVSHLYGQLTHALDNFSMPFVLSMATLKKSVHPKFLSLEKGGLVDIPNLKDIFLQIADIPGYLLRAIPAKVFLSTIPLQFSIKKIQKITLANFDIDFFKKVLPYHTIQSSEVFESTLESMLLKQALQDAQISLEKRIQKDLIQIANIGIPEEFLLKQMQKEAKNHPLNKKKYLDTVCWHIIVKNLAKEQNIHVSDDEMKNKLKEHMVQYYKSHNIAIDDQVQKNIEIAVMKTFTGDQQNNLQDIKQKLLQDKVFAYIQKHITLKKVLLSYQKFYQKFNQNV